MARLGNMYGPDATFVGVPAADLAEPASLSGAAAVIIGAPYDGGTSHRPGARFGPQAIRLTDYLPHDGSRPHLALGVDPLRELGVVDVGDVEMPPGEIETSILLHAHPELVREGYDTADWVADDRRHLLTTGMGEYTRSGVIGRPSLATAEKGKAVLASLVDSFASVLEILNRG